MHFPISLLNLGWDGASFLERKCDFMLLQNRNRLKKRMAEYNSRMANKNGAQKKESFPTIYEFFFPALCFFLANNSYHFGYSKIWMLDSKNGLPKEWSDIIPKNTYQQAAISKQNFPRFVFCFGSALLDDSSEKLCQFLSGRMMWYRCLQKFLSNHSCEKTRIWY